MFEEVFGFCGSILMIVFTIWFLIFVPTCSWHAYKDDLACKEKSGVYNCGLKEREHKQKIEIKETQ